MAQLSSEAEMPSGPAAQPWFLSSNMVHTTSLRVSSSIEVLGTTVTSAASMSTAAEGWHRGWFRAASKCSCQCHRDSYELHGDPSAWLTVVITGVTFDLVNILMALNAGHMWLKHNCTSLHRLDRRVCSGRIPGPWSAFALALKVDWLLLL